MKVSRIVITGRMRINDIVPVEALLTSFEDSTTEEVQLILSGSGGMYSASSCLSLAELVEDMHRKTGKRVTTNLMTGIGIFDAYIWLRCGINGRSMQTTSRIWLKVPRWSKFSGEQIENDLGDNDERYDEMAVLEGVNEYLPLRELDGKMLNIMNLDEFGLLPESYLHLMEQKNYGSAL